MDEGIYPMDVIKGIPGIYCWTDITRKEHHFKMGRAASIHKRLEDERRETSNAGHLIVHFILECAPGHEVDFEQFARQWLKSKSARLCDQEGCTYIAPSKEFFVYPDVQELEDYCKRFPQYLRRYAQIEDLPTSRCMLHERIKLWHDVLCLPDGILDGLIKPTDKQIDASDMEYARRREYFEQREITLRSFISHRGANTCLDSAHHFQFLKNKTGKTTNYTIADFCYDLSTGRLQIEPTA